MSSQMRLSPNPWDVAARVVILLGSKSHSKRTRLREECPQSHSEILKSVEQMGAHGMSVEQVCAHGTSTEAYLKKAPERRNTQSA